MEDCVTVRDKRPKPITTEASYVVKTWSELPKEEEFISKMQQLNGSVEDDQHDNGQQDDSEHSSDACKKETPSSTTETSPVLANTFFNGSYLASDGVQRAITETFKNLGFLTLWPRNPLKT